MKIFRKILYVALIVSIILILCPMETYAETETTVQKKMSITSDDTLSYIDSNSDDVINDGDIVYYGTEGFYIWDTPNNADLTNPDAKIRVLSVKKINTYDYLQDDSASMLIYLDPDTIDFHYIQYVNKLTAEYGTEYDFQSALIKKTHLKQRDGYDWAYEFDWWSRHWHNTWQMFLPAVVTTEGSWIENGTGPAYLRPAISVKVSDIIAAKNATYTVNITSQNGQVNIEAIANQVTINTVANEGYVLDTLTVTDKDGNAITLNGNKFTMPAKDIDIKANFKKQEYTVNFNSVGGSDVSSQTLRHGEVLITPTPPTKANYIFDGWYYEDECITKYDFATPVTTSFYLYAKWIPCEHSFEWKIDIEPTITEVGSKHEECTHCGAIRNNNTEIPVVENTVIPECEHNFEWKIDVEPTMAKVGLKHEECTHCGTVRNNNTEIPIIENTITPECEHNFEWKIDVEPTTTKVGSKHEECIHCGAIRNNNTEIPVVKNTVIPECEHNFKWKIDVKPTTTEVGLKHEECTHCGTVRNNGTEIPVVKTANTPKTSDPNNMLFYIILMLMTGFGCVILNNYKRDKK